MLGDIGENLPLGLLAGAVLDAFQAVSPSCKGRREGLGGLRKATMGDSRCLGVAQSHAIGETVAP